jgi:hypothetical protein
LWYSDHAHLPLSLHFFLPLLPHLTVFTDDHRKLRRCLFVFLFLFLSLSLSHTHYYSCLFASHFMCSLHLGYSHTSCFFMLHGSALLNSPFASHHLPCLPSVPYTHGGALTTLLSCCHVDLPLGPLALPSPAPE